MSVLSFPRLVLNGTTAWNPATQNNALPFGYDKDPIKVALPDGTTYDTYDDWLIALNSGGTTNGDWNVYGQFNCDFEAKVTNAVTGPGGNSNTDPIVNANLRFTGGTPKLVDVNPYSPVTSQVFLKNFGIESDVGGFSGPAQARMTSRRPFFSRNTSSDLNIAGSMGVVWQTVIAKDDITWTGGESSPALTALKDAMGNAGVKGIMMRVTSFTTVYFTQIVEGGWLNPTTAQDVYGKLADKWAKISPVNSGNIAATFNPALSTLTGAIGLWEEGDLMTVPNGRVMHPVAGAGGGPMGAAEAFVNESAGCVSLDLMNTIPSTKSDNTMSQYDILTLAIGGAGDGGPTVGSLAEAEYNLDNFLACGGIFDVEPQVDPASLKGEILSLTSNTGACVPMQQMAMTAEVDARSVYVDQGDAGQFTAVVSTGDGAPLPAGAMVKAWVVESESGVTTATLTGTTGPVAEMTYPVPANGELVIPFQSVDQGNCVIVLAPYTGTEPDQSSVVQRGLPVPWAGYAAVRVMPTNDDLDSITGDAMTWNVVYDNVLRPFDLVYRGMSCGVFDLGDENTVKANANAIAGFTNPDMFESPMYMPVTRDMSRGRYRLLMRYLGMPGGTPGAGV